MEWFWSQFKRGQRPDEATSTYRRLEHTAMITPASSATNRNPDKVLDADGDTLTIASLSGGLPLYVRLGPDGNPFIRVRERMVITRPFRRVTFRVGNLVTETANAAPQFAKVVAFISHGPLIKFPPKEYGLRRMPLMLYGISATTANTELGNILKKSGGVGWSTLGKGGGTLLITNTDLVGELYLLPITSGMGTPASGTRGYGPIRPGQSISLQLEDVLTYTTDAADAGGIVIKTLSGTCTYSLIASSSEMDEAENDQDTEHVPGLK